MQWKSTRYQSTWIVPRHPPFEGMLKPAFISQRQDEEPPNIWDTSSISGNVFAHPQASSSAPHPQELNSSKLEHMEKNYKGTKPHVYCREKWKTKARLRSEMPVRTVSQKFSPLQWRRLFKELWADQQRLQISISILTNSLRQLRLRAGR